MGVAGWDSPALPAGRIGGLQPSNISSVRKTFSTGRTTWLSHSVGETPTGATETVALPQEAGPEGLSPVATNFLDISMRLW